MDAMLETSKTINGVEMARIVRETIKSDGDFDGMFFEALLHVCMMVDEFHETDGMAISKYRKSKNNSDFKVLGLFVLLLVQEMFEKIINEGGSIES